MSIGNKVCLLPDIELLRILTVLLSTDHVEINHSQIQPSEAVSVPSLHLEHITATQSQLQAEQC
jgi:hypothetical protein